jgi:glutaminyl-peptide cyclotransferase
MFSILPLRRLLVALVLCLPCAESFAAAPILGYKVVAHYPHSTDNYTEGFFYLDGLFYEGTGIAGHSALFAIQPET